MLHILLNVSRFLEYHLYPRNFVKQYANHDPNVKVRIDHLNRGMGIFPWKFAWNIVVNFIVEHHSGYICWDCESAKYKNRKKKKKGKLWHHSERWHLHEQRRSTSRSLLNTYFRPKRPRLAHDTGIRPPILARRKARTTYRKPKQFIARSLDGRI